MTRPQEPPRLLDGRLKLRHLALVDALSERGSLVGAATQLRVTQPVLTRALRELEEILGVPLYERRPRGMVATIYGEAFTLHARAVLAQLTQAGRDVSELADAVRGTVTAGTHLAGSNLLLPQAVARIKRRSPHLVVVIREATPEALLADLEAGRIDLIVGRLTRLSSRATRAEHLYDEPVRLVTRCEHPAQRFAAATLRDLVDFPWILPGSETALRGELEQVFARGGLELPENRVECTSILTLRHLLLATDAIAALPALIAADDARLAALPLSLEPISQTVGVTLPAGRAPSPSTRTLLSELRAIAGDLRRTLS